MLHLPIGTGSLGRPQSSVAYMKSRKNMLPMYKYR